MQEAALLKLKSFVERYPRLLVITGAGISTSSQIPDYRDSNGNWKRTPPVMFNEFMNSEDVRKRYWGRSLVGWRNFSSATPNPAHYALVELEGLGHIQLLVTQNVDNLHQTAGQRRLLALHGTIDRVKCMVCSTKEGRQPFQQRLTDLNPFFSALSAPAAPDGDADLENIDFTSFNVPECTRCGGIVKPDAVFYGESVPQARHRQAEDNLAKADAVLVAGSSLMVYSSYRLAKKAQSLNKPIAALNLGVTRADDLLSLKISEQTERALPRLVEILQQTLIS